MKKLVFAFLLIATAAQAQEARQPPSKINIELTQQEAGALVGLIDEAVKSKGLAAAQAAAAIYEKLQTSAKMASSQQSEAENKSREEARKSVNAK